MSKRFLIVAALLILASPTYAAWYDGFAYPDGPLAGNDGWTGSGTGIDVTADETVRVGLGGTAFKATVNITPVAGTVLCTVYAFPGVSGGSNIWGAWYNDSLGRNYGRWYGSGNTARPRIAGTGLVLSTVTLVPGQWNKLEIVVNESTGFSSFYHNGAYLGQLQYSGQGSSGGVAQVQIENFGRSDAPNDYIYLDDMSVVPEPSSLLALSALGIGMLGYIKRRR